MKRVFVVRHAQSEWNGKKRISGQLDPSLSQKGRRQAEELARAFQRVSVGAVYSSSLLRSIETALPVAEFHRLPITSCVDFNELHFGVLQGRYRDYRDPEAKKLWDLRSRDKQNFRAPGGETFAELECRINRRLDHILRTTSEESMLIVGHRSTNRALLSRLMNWTQTTAINLNLRSKFVYEVILSSKPQLFTIDFAAGTRHFGFRE